MPPFPPPSLPPSTLPRQSLFDPWNSSSTGHQRADNRLSSSTSWRESRTAKLREQFASGAGGGKRSYDSVGAGSKDFGRDGRKENGGWEKGAMGVSEKGCGDLRTWVDGVAKKKKGEGVEKKMGEEEVICKNRTQNHESVLPASATASATSPNYKPLFQGLTVYINGSTAPLVSDHKLKQLLVTHGARISISLGRRSITHVILGTPNAGSGRQMGAGGGLAGGKLQREIGRVRGGQGGGVRFVGVEWALESIKAGTRLSEARFSNLSTGGAGQRSVRNMFVEKKTEYSVKSGK